MDGDGQDKVSSAAQTDALVARLYAGRPKREVAGTFVSQRRDEIVQHHHTWTLRLERRRQGERRRFSSADPTARDNHARMILDENDATVDFRQSARQRRRKCID
ncbi:hypothetical protein Tcan_08241 [Toxocara canis]|uniref:Uncharacterized protein n=1 Tax=Toxocara canis TaxID=6265 RepID=A0A0B2VNU6_TOXCA|nr:hypothetical protein Tcan_08241 [Toxocara canis]